MVALTSSPSSPTSGTTRISTAQIEAQYDAGLVRRFNAGDATAFAEIVARYRERMFSVAFGRLRNREDAEEITQDTFVRAHRALADFRGDSSLATWLHRITLNLSLNRYWYFFRRRRHLSQSLDGPLGENSPATLADMMASHEPDPAREAMTSDFTELVTLCMQRLPAAQHKILRLRNNLYRSYEEIATTLKISVGTVKSRIARARGHLQVLIGEACPEFSPDAPALDWFDPIRSSHRQRPSEA